VLRFANADAAQCPRTKARGVGVAQRFGAKYPAVLTNCYRTNKLNTFADLNRPTQRCGLLDEHLGLAQSK